MSLLCKGQPELADEVILTLLDAVHGAEIFVDTATAHFAALAIAERKARRRRPCAGGSCVALPCEDDVFDPATVAEIEREARKLALEFAAAKVRASFLDWKDRAEALGELTEILLLVASSCRRGWDLSHAPLHLAALHDVTALRARVAHLVRLRELIQRLGRLRAPAACTDETVLAKIAGPLRRVVPRKVPHADVVARTDVRGIERSDDLARMLPSEAIHLLRPRLKLVWHARRAERALLCYRAEGTTLRTELREETLDDGRQLDEPRPERGPMIVCVDTSGSMDGHRALIAKAVVLQIMMTAHDEERGCYVLSFSGPGDVVEHELAFTAEGVAALLRFVLLEFGGGTDVSEPLRRAMVRHREARWTKADILLVSDGQFEVPREIAREIAARRADSNLRVHGLVVGGTDTAAMAELCDDVETFAHLVAAEQNGRG
jgi:uncharacterized protein with von Willebrand factor type A (vWA) domain